MEYNKPKRKDRDGNNDYIKSLQKPSHKDKPKHLRREYTKAIRKSNNPNLHDRDDEEFL